MEQDQIYIYVLLLEKGRYYVGKTRDIEKRYGAHLLGHGSFWTSIYKPLHVLEHFLLDSRFAEENKTKEYMLRYGIYKVRGGPYSNLILGDEVTKVVQRQLWHATDKCFLCGEDHFVAECKYTDQKRYCCRCGGTHWESECIETNDIEGCSLPSCLVRH